MKHYNLSPLWQKQKLSHNKAFVVGSMGDILVIQRQHPLSSTEIDYIGAIPKEGYLEVIDLFGFQNNLVNLKYHIPLTAVTLNNLREALI